MIVGIVGRKGSGKTTAAKAVVDFYGYEHKRFAGPLKEMMKCLGLTDEEVDGSLKEMPCEKLCGTTPRFAMQTIGTEWGRDMIGGDLWVRAFETMCKNDVYVLEGLKNVVVDDVRFENEANLIRSYNGFIIFIDRGDDSKPRHASEDLDNLDRDVVICNNGSEQDLKEMVIDAIEEEREKRYGLRS